ncbi:hypothetical protein Tsubulata_035706, partial [Turnera subulata]
HLLPRDAATKPRRHRRPRRLRPPPYNSSVTPSPPTPSPVLAVLTSPPPFATATTAAIISPLRLAPLPRLSLVITELGNGDMGWIEDFCVNSAWPESGEVPTVSGIFRRARKWTVGKTRALDHPCASLTNPND